MRNGSQADLLRAGLQFVLISIQDLKLFLLLFVRDVIVISHNFVLYFVLRFICGVFLLYT